jgi:hypothetical protein
MLRWRRIALDQGGAATSELGPSGVPVIKVVIVTVARGDSLI